MSTRPLSTEPEPHPDPVPEHDPVPDSEKPLLLLVSPMDQQTRGYIMESAARSCRIWLLTEREPTWESAHIAGYTLVDTLDADALIEAAEPVPAVGVLCWDETRILPAARLAQSRGVPGPTPQAILTCRDKLLTRQAACAAGPARVRATAVGTLAEAQRAAAEIGYPVVIKPRALVGSYGASLVRSPGELHEAFVRASTTEMVEVRERFERPALIEEFLDGPEISVDALCFGGETTPLFIARKELGYPPYFEEVGHVVDAADPLLSDPELLEALHRVHEAVGLTAAWTHTEWKLTGRGPRLVEVNARSGGDLIGYLGRLATGIDAGRAAVDLAMGRAPRMKPTRARAAAIRFLYPPHDCVVTELSVDRGRLPGGIDMITALAGPGDVLQLPPIAHVKCRYGLIVAVADDSDECAAALDKATAAVTLSCSPLGAAAPA